MFGTKKTVKAKGIELIDEVAGRFNNMIDELNRGVDDCQNERGGIQTQIEQLHQRDAILDSSVKRATTIASNLRKLIGE